MNKDSKNDKLVPHNDKLRILRMILAVIVIIIAMYFGYDINMRINPATSEYSISFTHDQQDQDNAKEDSVVEDQANLPSTTDTN